MSTDGFSAPAPPPAPPPSKMTEPPKVFQREPSITGLKNDPQSVGRRAYQYAAAELQDLACHKCLSFQRSVDPILQVGPQCGIVALGMMESILRKGVTVDMLTNISRERGFSKQGELFSARFAEVLASETYGHRTSLLDVTQSTDRSDLMCFICRGDLILIPYDPDKNYSPVKKKGHKAHWALITGFFVALKEKEFTSISSSKIDLDSSTPDLYHCQQTSFSPSASEAKTLDSAPLLYVYAMQGKSQHVGIWKFNDLIDSCCNLVEIDPERLADADEYNFPENGIENELCGKVVVVHLDESELNIVID